jgi:radical SAM protein with 4Fe4S-binding SPASM domain
MILTDRPSYLQFYPTLACNERCDFCFNRNITPVKDVTIPEFERLLAVIGKAGIPSIDILGGEPTLHPDLLNLMDLLSNHQLKVNISSNGSDVPLLRLLSEHYPQEAVRVGVSVNTPPLSLDLHNYILGCRPVLKSIFDPQSIIPEFCRSYLELPGIDYFLIYMDVLEVRDLVRSVPFYKYYRKLERLKKDYGELDGVFCSGFIPDVRACPALKWTRCPAGTTKLSVLPDGTVYPCYLFFRYPQFALGNLLHDDFETIWRHPILDHFRRFDKNRCPKSACDLHGVCHGGCPALSYLFYGDLQGPDPRCLREDLDGVRWD